MDNIGKEYGTAVYRLARKAQCVSLYADGLRTVTRLFADYPEYMRILTAPGIPLSKRTALVRAVWETRIPQEVMTFLLVLCERGHLPHLFTAAETFFALQDSDAQIRRVHITSAVPLTSDETARLHRTLERLHACRIIPIYTVDPALIGGVIIETDGTVTDGSIRTRLRKIQEVIRK